MSLLALFLLAGDVLCCTTRQVAFKAASHGASADQSVGHWRGLSRSPLLWLGIICFIGEAMFWLAFVALAPLSVAVMVGTINIATVMVAGRVFFGDRITAARGCAILLIAVGVVLVGWGGS